MAFSKRFVQIGQALAMIAPAVFSSGVAAAQSAPETPDAPAGYKSARPNGRPGEWISDNDYPPISLRSGVTGVVAFRLTVAIDGSPSACEIVGAGVNAELNQATCALLMKRAHFFPATGPDGKPVMGTFTSSVKWQIPDLVRPIPTNISWQVAYDIHADGNVTNCHVAMSGLTAAQMANGSEASVCPRVGRYHSFIALPGKPSTRHVVISTSTTVTDAP